MVHHVAFLVEFFAAAVLAAVEDRVQSLGVFIHNFLSEIGHAFSFALLESVLEYLQLVEVVLDRSG